MLTENQIESYHRDGYVKVESLFTNEEAEELGSEMIKVIPINAGSKMMIQSMIQGQRNIT